MSAATRMIAMTGPLAAEGLHRLLPIIASGGDEALIVGGAVRNALIGRPVTDIDIATTALPERVMERVTRAGLRAIPTGIAHGTITVVIDGISYEVTTLREDIATDGRHAVVQFGRDFAKDASRRDFTINALYADAAGEVADFTGGLDDIIHRRVRFIGAAQERIKEDYLRILRFFRFAADYSEGPFDADALQAIAAEKEGLTKLSAERIRAELLKIVMTRRAVEAIATMARLELFDLMLGLQADTATFSRLVTADAGSDAILRLAALVLRRPDDAALLKDRLRLSRAESDRLSRLADAVVGLAGLPRPLQPKTIRRIAFRSGRRITMDALLLDAARRNEHVSRELMTAAGSAPSLSPFTGDMVLKRGFATGPEVGAVIRRAEEAWMDADFPTEAAQLAAILASASGHPSAILPRAN